MLAVCVVIAVLLLVLIPAGIFMLVGARSTQCLNNLRQLPQS